MMEFQNEEELVFSTLLKCNKTLSKFVHLDLFTIKHAIASFILIFCIVQAFIFILFNMFWDVHLDHKLSESVQYKIDDYVDCFFDSFQKWKSNE